jgi:hypothetical protein
VVYLATVAAVEDLGIDETGPGMAMMRAQLVVDRMLRSSAPPPPPANTTVRFRRMVRAEDGLSGQLFYRLSAGDRVVVFASSYEPSYPIEMIVGPAKAVAAQVETLRAYLAGMDEMTQRLHGVTPAVRTQQMALYDRILAEFRSSPAR